MPGALVSLGTLFIGIAGISIGNAGTIKIDGSSTVYPITEAVAEDFQIAKRGKARVTVGISGTGGGFKKFCRGEVDITNASRPIMQKEMDKCKKAGIEYVEMPVAFDALTIAINPKNNWSKTITVAELKKMWTICMDFTKPSGFQGKKEVSWILIELKAKFYLMTKEKLKTLLPAKGMMPTS